VDAEFARRHRIEINYFTSPNGGHSYEVKFDADVNVPGWFSEVAWSSNSNGDSFKCILFGADVEVTVFF